MMISKKITVFLLLSCALHQFAEDDFKPVCINDPENYQWAMRIDSCSRGVVKRELIYNATPTGKV